MFFLQKAKSLITSLLMILSWSDGKSLKVLREKNASINTRVKPTSTLKVLWRSQTFSLILTGEGGTSPSRFKHIIKVGERYRRLVPDELDQLQGFPKGWTNTGMSDNNRAFCMGNALVVGVVNRIGKEIYKEL